MDYFENVKKWLQTDEGKKSVTEFVEKLNREENIKNKQLENFNSKFNDENVFNNFLEKVIIKYTSNEYRNFWYDKGIEPPEDLYWFLYEYAKKYGRECNEEEWEKYGNIFTSALYFIHGNYFNRMDGQGSVIKIIKKLID